MSSINVDVLEPYQQGGEPYAVAAANTSILRAFTTRANASENKTVKIAIAPSCARGLFTKYSTKIEEVGRMEDTIALIASVTLRICLSSYL